jgi:hypothetical protein
MLRISLHVIAAGLAAGIAVLIACQVFRPKDSTPHGLRGFAIVLCGTLLFLVALASIFVALLLGEGIHLNWWLLAVHSLCGLGFLYAAKQAAIRTGLLRRPIYGLGHWFWVRCTIGLFAAMLITLGGSWYFR